jgi:hypothetical protein
MMTLANSSGLLYSKIKILLWMFPPLPPPNLNLGEGQHGTDFFVLKIHRNSEVPYETVATYRMERGGKERRLLDFLAHVVLRSAPARLSTSVDSLPLYLMSQDEENEVRVCC